MRMAKRDLIKGALCAVAGSASAMGRAATPPPAGQTPHRGGPENAVWAKVARSRRVVATGLHKPEGPTLDRSGTLCVVEMAAGLVSRVGENGQVTPVARVGGMPNGMALGPDGNLYVCNNGGFGKERSRVERVGPDGKVEWFLSEVDGTPLNAANDIAFTDDRHFYCTDPRQPVTGTFYTHVCPPGDLIFAAIDGTATRIKTAIRFPNGIAVSPDGRTLVVAECQTGQIHAFAIEGPGRLGPARIFARLPTGLPDGIRFDSQGNLIVCGFGSGNLHVFSPDGSRVLTSIAFDDNNITNTCFGGSDGKTLYVTEMSLGRVSALRWPYASLPPRR